MELRAGAGREAGREGDRESGEVWMENGLKRGKSRGEECREGQDRMGRDGARSGRSPGGH